MELGMCCFAKSKGKVVVLAGELKANDGKVFI
jgi:hypothetical protein